MQKIFMLALLAIASGGANAQFYKCIENGRTIYTEKPCSFNASGQTLTLGSNGGVASQPDSGAGRPQDLGKAACATAVPGRLRLKDPYNAVFGAPVGGDPVVSEVADTKVMARKYTVSVNAKNLQGAYVGDKRVSCITSSDGRRVISVDTSQVDPSTLN